MRIRIVTSNWHWIRSIYKAKNWPNREQIKQHERHVKKLQQKLNAAQQSSPGSPVHHHQTQHPPVDASTKKHPPPVQNLEDEFAHTPKKTNTNSSETDSAKLDGVQKTNKTTVGGIKFRRA